MSETKIPKFEAVTDGVWRLGLLAISAALTLSTLGSPEDAKRAILPTQPVPEWATEGGQSGDNNPIRREREETAPHFISYNEVQRTPGRSGRV